MVQDFSHQQYVFSRGSQPKPSFATITERGDNPTYNLELLQCTGSLRSCLSLGVRFDGWETWKLQGTTTPTCSLDEIVMDLKAANVLWYKPRQAFRMRFRRIYMGVSKNRGVSPQIIHLFIGFSMIFTIHFGIPLFLEAPIYESS